MHGHGLSLKSITSDNTSNGNDSLSDTDTDSFYSASDVFNSDAINEFPSQDKKYVGQACISRSSSSSNLVSSVLTGLHEVVEAVEDEISTAVESNIENEVMGKLSIEERRKLTLEAANLKEPHPEENSFCNGGLDTWLTNSEKLLKKTIATTSDVWDWTGMKNIVCSMGEGIMNLVESTLEIPSPEQIAKQNIVQQRHVLKEKQNGQYRQDTFAKKDSDKDK